jgi:hypothetical protein
MRNVVSPSSLFSILIRDIIKIFGYDKYTPPSRRDKPAPSSHSDRREGEIFFVYAQDEFATHLAHLL